jgi:Tfp pilus assembly protein PilO
MKNKIKPFLIRLIKDNIYYIVGNIFIFILIIITINIGISELSKYKSKITALETENDSLKNKVTLMNSSIPKSDVLDEDVKFLNTLIPDTEDYFSIIFALEQLSRKSNFQITSYSVNVKASTNEKLKINVTGTGDSQSLINFLKDYNFSGGRLITSDKVQLDPNFSGSIIIDLTFYTKKTKAGSKLEVSAQSSTYKDLDAIKNKVNFSFVDNTVATDSGSLDYPKKSDPF